jgi:dTDP-4-dehydrorhamnose reductase
LKVLVFGTTGQLGQALAVARPARIDFRTVGRDEVDLRQPAAVSDVIASHKPSIVINAAAYTAVDLAESASEEAHAINADAVGAMAIACADARVRLVHVSTDFVFDGCAGRPYRVDDVTEPLNAYGASKLKGEQKIAAVTSLDWRVVRTAWVYSGVGKNFLLTMLRLFRERDEVRVVCDQVGTPTSAATLADCVWSAAMEEDGQAGVLHFTDAGVASWYDFAVAIYEEARDLSMLTRDVRITPILTSQYPTPARRPSYSVLDKSETWARLKIEPVHWRVALRAVLTRLK